MSAKREKAPKDLGEVAMGRRKKKQSSPKKTYMPDETGHMVEWVGDHPIFVGRWTKADDDDEDGGTHE
jgi:hypothetical protein|tara:strand:- start:1446 stop:1649 length:204 start_codon:yes stop_codon:yes gene_type:complete